MNATASQLRGRARAASRVAGPPAMQYLHSSFFYKWTARGVVVNVCLTALPNSLVVVLFIENDLKYQSNLPLLCVFKVILQCCNHFNCMHFILFSQIIYMLIIHNIIELYSIYCSLILWQIFFSHWTVVKWQYFCIENCIRMKGFFA